jgi:hypothetical protein
MAAALGEAARRRVAERFSLRAHAAAMAEWLGR